MPGIDVPQIEECGAVTQLLEQDAVGPHAQRAFEQLLGANLGQADLQGADLRGCDLRDSNLQGARLTEALLEGAQLPSGFSP